MYQAWERVNIEKSQTAQRFVKEMLRYVVFVFFLTHFTLSNRPAWGFESKALVRDQLVAPHFRNITTNQHFFYWLRHQLAPVLFPVKKLSGDPLTSEDQNYVARNNRLLGPVRLRQIRTKWDTGCNIDEYFSDWVTRCQAAGFSSSVEETAPYGQRLLPIKNNDNVTIEYEVRSDRWKWQSAEELCEGSQSNTITARYCKVIVLGKKGAVYPSSGYVVDLPPMDYYEDLERWETTVEENRVSPNVSNGEGGTEAPPRPRKHDYILRTIDELEDNRWIDQQTAQFSLEFAMYNPNVKLMTVVRLYIEWFSTGGMYLTESVKFLDLVGISGPFEVWLLLVEMGIALSVVIYMYGKIIEIIQFIVVKPKNCIVCTRNKIITYGLDNYFPCPMCSRVFNIVDLPCCPECHKDIPITHLCWIGFWQDIWNWLDVVNLLIFSIVIAFRFKLRSDLGRLSFTGNETTFVAFYPLVWQDSLINAMNAFNMLLCFIKTLKYLGKIRSLALLVKTVRTGVPDAVKMLSIFSIVFMGFALAFYLAFGQDLWYYRTWLTAATSLLRSTLMQFEYDQQVQSNSILAPFFFFFFNVLVSLILMNMFISIVDGAYNVAKVQQSVHAYDFLNSSLKLFFRQQRKKLLKCLCRKGLDLEARTTDILVKVASIPELTELESDDVKLFLKQMNDAPDPRLISEICLAFTDCDRFTEYTYNHYLRLKQCISKTRTLFQGYQAQRIAGIDTVFSTYDVASSPTIQPDSPDLQMLTKKATAADFFAGVSPTSELSSKNSPRERERSAVQFLSTLTVLPKARNRFRRKKATIEVETNRLKGIITKANAAERALQTLIWAEFGKSIAEFAPMLPAVESMSRPSSAADGGGVSLGGNRQGPSAHSWGVHLRPTSGRQGHNVRDNCSNNSKHGNNVVRPLPVISSQVEKPLEETPNPIPLQGSQRDDRMPSVGAQPNLHALLKQAAVDNGPSTNNKESLYNKNPLMGSDAVVVPECSSDPDAMDDPLERASSGASSGGNVAISNSLSTTSVILDPCAPQQDWKKDGGDMITIVPHNHHNYRSDTKSNNSSAITRPDSHIVGGTVHNNSTGPGGIQEKSSTHHHHHQLMVGGSHNNNSSNNKRPTRSVNTSFDYGCPNGKEGEWQFIGKREEAPGTASATGWQQGDTLVPDSAEMERVGALFPTRDPMTKIPVFWPPQLPPHAALLRAGEQGVLMGSAKQTPSLAQPKPLTDLSRSSPFFKQPEFVERTPPAIPYVPNTDDDIMYKWSGVTTPPKDN